MIENAQAKPKEQASSPAVIDLGTGQDEESNEIPLKGFKDKVREIFSPAKDLHKASARSHAERTYERAERIAAETSGAVSGLTRVITGSVVGGAGGVLAGLRGLSGAEAVKRVRLKGEDLRQIGTWDEYQERKTKKGSVEVLLMDLDYTLELEPAQDALYRIPLSGASKTTLHLDGGDVTALSIPLKDENGELTGFCLAAETDGREVYVWYDQE